MSKAPEPLSPEEQKMLDDLQKRRDAALQAEQDAKVASEREAFAPVAKLIRSIDLDAILDQTDVALASPGIDLDTRNRLVRLRQILELDLNGLHATKERLGA